MSRSEACASALQRALSGVEGVRSITLVGSVVDRDDLTGIADIDTVVVLDRLTAAAYRDAVAAVGELRGDDLGWPGRRVRVNATLGPLKFDRPDEIVVHLMMYDVASHREHALRSPFTCLDWERSTLCLGTPLAGLYPVGRLAPRDFFSARRGVANYVSDLESGTLSFRRYVESGDVMVEATDSLTLDRRHQGEYAYHIVRNSIVNALKMRTACNRRWDETELRAAWMAELGELAEWIPFYEQLRAVKLARRDDFSPDTVARTRAFVAAFQSSLDRSLEGAFRLRLVRHGMTALNDGTFLGSGRDPDLIAAAEIPASADRFDTVYASPLRRAAATAKALAPGVTARIDPRLSEIDYGAAEGLTYPELRARFPGVARAWDAGEDVAFPEGESTRDVLERARAFLDDVPPGAGSALAMTHNVVMRAIVADVLGLELRKAHRIPISHLQALDLCRIDRRWYPDWDAATKARLIDGYAGYK